MILKPSEEPVNGREDLAPVAESFWCHRHILYPVRSSEYRRAQEMRGCFRAIPATVRHPHTNRPQSEQVRPTHSGDGRGDTEQIDLPKPHYFFFPNKCSQIPCLSMQILLIIAYNPVIPPAQGSTACGSQLVRKTGVSWVRFTPRHGSSTVKGPNPAKGRHDLRGYQQRHKKNWQQ